MRGSLWSETFVLANGDRNNFEGLKLKKFRVIFINFPRVPIIELINMHIGSFNSLMSLQGEHNFLG